MPRVPPSNAAEYGRQWVDLAVEMQPTGEDRDLVQLNDDRFIFHARAKMARGQTLCGMKAPRRARRQDGSYVGNCTVRGFPNCLLCRRELAKIASRRSTAKPDPG